MKALILPLYFAMFFFSLQSCSRQSDDLANPGTQAQIQNVTAGTWKVTLFTDSGNDETTDLSGYSFQFNTDGTLKAIKNGITQNGTWSLSSSSGKYNIDLGAKTDSNKPLGELTDDWKIIAITSTEIRLTDDNPSSNEFLTFTRN